jgi:hypothetical protein
MKYTSEAGKVAFAKLRSGEQITVDEMDAIAMDWLRYWQGRYAKPVYLTREKGICSGWFNGLMPRFLVRTLVETGRWQISVFEVPSADGSRKLRTSTFHPVVKA